MVQRTVNCALSVSGISINFTFGVKLKGSTTAIAHDIELS